MHTRNRYPHPGRPKKSVHLVNINTQIEEHAKVKMKRDKGSLSDGQYLTHLIEHAGNEMRMIAQQAAELNEFRKILPKLNEQIAIYKNNLTESDRATEEMRQGLWMAVKNKWKMRFDWGGYKAIRLEVIQEELKTRNKQETTQCVTPKIIELQNELEQEYNQIREKEKHEPLNMNEWWHLHKKEIREKYLQGKKSKFDRGFLEEIGEKSGYSEEEIMNYCTNGEYKPRTPEELNDLEKEWNERKTYRKNEQKVREIINDLKNNQIQMKDISQIDLSGTTLTVDEVMRNVHGMFRQVFLEREELSEEDLRKTGMNREQYKDWCFKRKRKREIEADMKRDWS